MHVSSAGKVIDSEEVINITSRLSRLCIESVETDFNNINNHLNDHDYIQDIREITAFSMSVVEYIAGYVVFQLKKRLLSEVCTNELTDSNIGRNNLINVKIRGRFMQPSDMYLRFVANANMKFDVPSIQM